ncbi:hypothetical protein [Oceaniglobus trochenteri]|uniref:hypothetical protein n=1 Tax=Oceaniglobus trochenteri TaxID=2763260 RepID=UPI001CFF5F05|nr:hypothetical protein [Oceaniglobus trochenteri]
MTCPTCNDTGWYSERTQRVYEAAPRVTGYCDCQYGRDRARAEIAAREASQKREAAAQEWADMRVGSWEYDDVTDGLVYKPHPLMVAERAAGAAQ